MSRTLALPSRVTHARGSSITRRPLTGLLFVAPALAVVAVFFLVPLAMMFVISASRWTLLGGNRGFAGLDNFRSIPSNDLFTGAIAFTVAYALITTAVVFLASFVLVAFAGARRRGVRFYRTAYFLPFVVGGAPAALIWLIAVNDNVGVVPALLRALGFVDGPTAFLSSSESALITAMTLIVWKSTGFTMLVLLVGLSSIPPELDEAARVDGANTFQRLRFITIPLLRPTLALLLVLSITGGLLAFDQFVILTQGRNGTLTVVYSIVVAAFTSFDLGKAAALSVVLLLALVVLNALQLYALRKRDDS
jgi:multiple sugar transport system permease protein